MGAYRFPSGTISHTWGIFISDHRQDAIEKVSNYSFNKEWVSKSSPYMRGSVSLHGHQYQCLGMYSELEHMTNVDKVVDFSSWQKGNCHQVIVSFHLIKTYFSFIDVNQGLHYDSSVEILKKVTYSLCIKWDVVSCPYKSIIHIELTHDKGTEPDVSDLIETDVSLLIIMFWENLAWS